MDQNVKDVAEGTSNVATGTATNAAAIAVYKTHGVKGAYSVDYTKSKKGQNCFLVRKIVPPLF
ncbi:MAG: hypothetical protein K8R46_08325 [Pirellulales bacterium]|nr:hypothetical protein [Pirellulales bacterium]